MSSFFFLCVCLSTKTREAGFVTSVEGGAMQIFQRDIEDLSQEIR